MVNATKDNFDVGDLVKFQELLLGAKKPLYEGCPDFTKLSAIVKLLNLKGKYGASDKFFTELLGLIKKMLPAEVVTTRQAYYYGVLQEIWVLDYRFRQIPLFKCDWVNHRAGGMKRDNLGYTLIDLNNLGHKVDPFILVSQARQVFYLKDQIDKKLSIIFKTPPKNYKDTYDEVNEEFSTVIHQRNDNILPCVNRCGLGNESLDDYYRTDCGGVVIQKSNLHIAFAACICTLHLQLAFASKHLHIAFAACICKQAFARCTCTLHLQAKVLIKTLLKVKQVENKQREKKPRFNKQFLKAIFKLLAKKMKLKLLYYKENALH
ncbi:putative transposase-associated domain-containing protein [Tanacetum coccineum]